MAKKVRPVLSKPVMPKGYKKPVDWLGESKRIPSGPGAIGSTKIGRIHERIFPFWLDFDFFSCK